MVELYALRGRQNLDEPDLPRENAGVAREANHRVANNLAMIAGLVRSQKNAIVLNDEPLSAAEVSAMLGVVAGRIEAVASMHRSLADAEAAGAIDLNQFIGTMCTRLVDALAQSEVKLTFDLNAGCTVKAEQALPIALIVNEAVTNSLKYAHPTGVAGLLHVSCHGEDGDAVVIEVVDDGIGLPEDFDVGHGGAVGLRVIRTLSRQLSAEFELNQRPIGVQFRLSVPLGEAPPNTLRR
jgi:two-component sensor histidine kinase